MKIKIILMILIIKIIIIKNECTMTGSGNSLGRKFPPSRHSTPFVLPTESGMLMQSKILKIKKIRFM
jgi:hypothetical protein